MTETPEGGVTVEGQEKAWRFQTLDGHHILSRGIQTFSVTHRVDGDWLCDYLNALEADREELALRISIYNKAMAQLQAAEAERDKLKGEALDCWFGHDKEAKRLHAALAELRTYRLGSPTFDYMREKIDNVLNGGAVDFYDRLEAAEATLTTRTTLLRQAKEALRNFARSEHREQFPHVKPDKREQEADDLITAIASALEGEIGEAG